MTGLWIQRVVRLVGVLVLFGVPIRGSLEPRSAGITSRRNEQVQTAGLPQFLDGRGRRLSLSLHPLITRIINTTFEGIGRSS